MPRVAKESALSVRSSALAAAILVLTVAACAPGVPRSAGEPGQTASPVPGAHSTQTLVVVVRLEPVSLAAKPVTATGTGVNFVTRVFNADLDLTDGDDQVRPYLAETLPELNTDSWKVFPDGR